MKKIDWSIIGMIVSVVLVILGVLTLAGAIDGGVPVDTYDLVFDSNSSGFAKFGTDFYTYVNNNAAQASLYAIRIYALLRTVSGLFLIGLGLLSFCFFAAKKSADTLTIAGAALSAAEREPEKPAPVEEKTPALREPVRQQPPREPEPRQPQPDPAPARPAQHTLPGPVTLRNQLGYALQYQTDSGLINYLNTRGREGLSEENLRELEQILSGPQDKIRDRIRAYLGR